jgi:phosphoribosylformimino-5-aminoimidazole carboxamide ribotide isomerase
MRIIPVIDLQNGVVVRGIAGRREEYRPLVSRLTASCRPIDVVRAIQDHFGLTEFYLADLDAIGGSLPSFEVYAAIRALGCRLWADAGVREADQARPLAAAGLEGIIVGLETLKGPDVLQDLCRTYGSERLILSLDMKEWKPLGNLDYWERKDAWGIADQAVAIGVRRLIVLDLAQVGMGQGIGTESLCRELTAAYPLLEVCAGGGIRGVTDLRRLQEGGIRGALVASALHDGRLIRADVAEFLDK